jgi:hypothetical protein
MKILHKNKFKREAFTLVDVSMALVVTALFGLAAFETNSRLVLALKNQKGSTAATMALQERKESLRGTGFNSIADANYMHDKIFTIATSSEGPLSSLSETVTVDAYPTPTGSPAVLLRNSQYPSCQIVSSNSNLAYSSGNPHALRVDVVLTWTSSNNRSRTRQFSEIFTYPGNIGL